MWKAAVHPCLVILSCVTAALHTRFFLGPYKACCALELVLAPSAVAPASACACIPLGLLRCCFFFVPAPSLQAPDKATYIEIEFEKGDPVKLDGQALSPAAMLTALNKVAGDNGIGRIDIVESRFVGEHFTGLECNINTS